MEHAGVPISIISKWARHYDSAFKTEYATGPPVSGTIVTD
jgi:hypothetical protein